MNYWQISALINIGAILIMALFIFVKQRHQPISKIFLAANIAFLVYMVGFFFWSRSKDAQSALFWSRVLIAGGALTVPTMFHFMIYLLGRLKQMKIFVVISYSISIFLILVVGTPLVVNRASPILSFPFWPQAGPLFLLHTLNASFFPMLGLYLMWKDYPHAFSVKKQQIKFMMIAIFIGALCALTTLPQAYGIKIYPLFFGATWLYVFFMFYAIIRYRAFEIDTVLHQTILWITTTALLIAPASAAISLSMSWFINFHLLLRLSILTFVLLVFLIYFNRLKPRIDHLFRRRKYDYQMALSEIPSKIGTELELNSLANKLLKEFKEVLYIQNGLLLVKLPEENEYQEVGSIGYDRLKERGIEKLKLTNLPQDSVLIQHLTNFRNALEKEQIEIDPQYIKIKPQAQQFFKENVLEVLVPVVLKGELKGLLGLGKKENLQAYRLRDIQLLEQLGQALGITLDNALHHRDIVENERLSEELRLGREIQIGLLPKQVPAVEGLEIAGFMEPAEEIGGDYFDYLPKAKDRIAIAIGDVSGKGVAAGLLMAVAKTAIYTISSQVLNPRDILIKANDILYQYMKGDKFMTMLYLEYNNQEKKIIYSSAGHEHIIHYQCKNNRCLPIKSGGFMLGMLPDIKDMLEQREFNLESGDKVVLYTDGVTEAENKSRERFGLNRLIQSVERNASKNVQELLDSLYLDVKSFMNNYPQYDDITLITMEVIGG